MIEGDVMLVEDLVIRIEQLCGVGAKIKLRKALGWNPQHLTVPTEDGKRLDDLMKFHVDWGWYVSTKADQSSVAQVIRQMRNVKLASHRCRKMIQETTVPGRWFPPIDG